MHAETIFFRRCTVRVNDSRRDKGNVELANQPAARQWLDWPVLRPLAPRRTESLTRTVLLAERIQQVVYTSAGKGRGDATIYNNNFLYLITIY